LKINLNNLRVVILILNTRTAVLPVGIHLPHLLLMMITLEVEKGKGRERGKGKWKKSVVVGRGVGLNEDGEPDDTRPNALKRSPKKGVKRGLTRGRTLVQICRVCIRVMWCCGKDPPFFFLVNMCALGVFGNT
jgi:hypothetical protein